MVLQQLVTYVKILEAFLLKTGTEKEVWRVNFIVGELYFSDAVIKGGRKKAKESAVLSEV